MYWRDVTNASHDWHRTRPCTTRSGRKRVHLRLQTAQRARLEGDAADMAAAFDEALHKLRARRHELLVDVKAAEAAALVLWQEHALLADFSTKDAVLGGKVAEKERERKVRRGWFAIFAVDGLGRHVLEAWRLHCFAF